MTNLASLQRGRLLRSGLLLSIAGLLLGACGEASQSDGPGGGGAGAGITAGNGTPSTNAGNGTTGTNATNTNATTGTNTSGSNNGSSSTGVPLGPEPTGMYGIDDHDVISLPAGIGFHDEDYGYVLHVSPPATTDHAAGAAFDGRDAVRFYPRGINEGYAGPRELHFEQTMPGLTQLNVRWLAKYSPVMHRSPPGKQLIVVRTPDPLDLGGTGRSISIWRTDPTHEGMVLGPCDGIVCSYVGADPPYWPDGSDTFWIGPQASGGHADEWVSFEQEYVTDRARTLTGSPSATLTTVAGTDRVQLDGAHFTQDIEVYDTLLIQDGPDASRYIVRQIVSDTEVRVDRSPVGAGNTQPFAGGTGSYRFAHAYSKIYIHTRDGQFAGAYHTVPQWDTGAFGTIAYFDILGGYMTAVQDLGDDGWFMLDRLRIDSTYIGPPEGFVE